MQEHNNICISKNKTKRYKKKTDIKRCFWKVFRTLLILCTLKIEKLSSKNEMNNVCKYLLSLCLQTLMTVRHRHVRTGALASMGSTPSSVSAQTAGRAVCVMLVSVCGCVCLRELCFWGQHDQQHRYANFRDEP